MLNRTAGRRKAGSSHLAYRLHSSPRSWILQVAESADECAVGAARLDASSGHLAAAAASNLCFGCWSNTEGRAPAAYLIAGAADDAVGGDGVDCVDCGGCEVAEYPTLGS